MRSARSPPSRRGTSRSTRWCAKIGAGLAAGCSIIVKAPEETPASPAALIGAFQDAGLPEGVLWVLLLYGTPSEISEYLIASPIIRKITFTGSTPVGKLLAGLAGKHMKRVSMELAAMPPSSCARTQTSTLR
ncbi:aldehyde dehydrogenase family protein [Sphingomonas sp. MMS24-JH45]